VPNVLVAEQLTNNFDEVPQYESKFAEGDTGELHIYLQNDLNEEQIDILQQDILSKGVVLTAPIVQDARILIIKFKKALAPLSIIASSMSLVASTLVGWQIYKTSGTAIPNWLWFALGGVILVTIAASTKR